MVGGHVRLTKYDFKHLYVYELCFKLIFLCLVIPQVTICSGHFKRRTAVVDRRGGWKVKMQRRREAERDGGRRRETERYSERLV